MTADSPRPDPGLEQDNELTRELVWVRRLARRLVGGDGDDVAQDVAVAALSRPQPVVGLRAWLGAVTRKRAARVLRDRGRRDAHERRLTPPAPADDAAAVLDRLRWQREITDAVESLPETYRTVVVLRFLDGLSPGEIERRRHVASATVRQQVRRGLEMLRARLATRRGADWRAGLAALAWPGGAKVTGWVLGATWMTKKTWSVVAAVVVLAGALALVQPWRTTSAPTSGGASGTDRAAVAASEVDRLIGSGPSGDRTAVEVDGGSDGATEAALRIEVVDADGTPVEGAAIHVAVDAKVVACRTDAAGRAALDAPDGDGHVLVVPPGRVPVLRAYDAATEDVRIALPAGGVLAGRVTLDGVIPSEPIELIVYGSRPCLDASLPEALADAWPWDPEQPEEMRIPTGVDGAFTIRGLPDNWSGRIRVGFGTPFALSPSATDLDLLGWRLAAVPATRADIALGLASVPIVTARVVWSDGEPVPDASVSVRCWFDHGQSSPMAGVVSDERGELAIGMTPSRVRPDPAFVAGDRRPGIQRVRAWWTHEAARERVERTWEWPVGRRQADLGTLVLDRATELHVRVTDSDGEPVAGAEFDARRTIAATDADGHGRIAVADPGRRAFRIGAPGFEVTSQEAIQGTGVADDPLTFELRRANRLDVVVEPGGFEHADLRLEVHSDTPVFTAQSGHGLPSRLHRIAGTSAASSAGWHPDGTGEIVFDAADSGSFRMSSVRAGERVRLRLLDRLEQVAAEAVRVLPGAGEHARATLEATAPVASLTGVLTSSDGPVAGASVRLIGFADVESPWRTDADGRFAIRVCASGASGELVVEADGHVRTRIPITLLPGARVLDTRLERGHTLILRVVDESGAPVDGRLWLFGVDGQQVRGHALGDGRYRVSHAPGGTATVEFLLAGRTIERRIEVGTADEITLSVPPTARLTLTGASPDLARPVDLRFSNAADRNVQFGERVGLGGGGATVVLWPGVWDVTVIPVDGDTGPLPPLRWEIPAGASARVLGR